MFCKECGNELKTQSKFCSRCGSGNNSDKGEQKEELKLKLESSGRESVFLSILGIILGGAILYVSQIKKSRYTLNDRTISTVKSYQYDSSERLLIIFAAVIVTALFLQLAFVIHKAMKRSYLCVYSSHIEGQPFKLSAQAHVALNFREITSIEIRRSSVIVRNIYNLVVRANGQQYIFRSSDKQKVDHVYQLINQLIKANK